MGKVARILRVVVASPSDVQSERDLLPAVMDELNRGVAADKDLRLEILRWETDVYPGFHPEGPQGVIDSALHIEDCDILIGIFWKRFGSPLKDAKSGTEHEIQLAYEAWKQKQSPQLMVYFNERPYTPKSKEETDQWGQVLDFKRNFPKEGLWSSYNGKAQFERLVRNGLTQLIRRWVAVGADRKGRSQITAAESAQRHIDDTFRKLVVENLTSSEWRLTLRTMARKLPTLVKKSASTQGRKELEIVNDIVMFTRVALKGDSPDPITLAREQLSTSFKVAWVSVYPPLDVVDGFYGWYRASREALISNSEIVFFQRDPTYVDLFRRMLRDDPAAKERVELREDQIGCQVWCVSPIIDTFPVIQTVIWNPGNLDFGSPDRMRVFVNSGEDIRLIQDAQKERFSLAPDYALRIGELMPPASELMWRRLDTEYQRFVEVRRTANLPIPSLPDQIRRRRGGPNARKRLFQE